MGIFRSTCMRTVNGRSHDLSELLELALIAIARNEETISFPLKMVRYRAFKWLRNLTTGADDKGHERSSTSQSRR